MAKNNKKEIIKEVEQKIKKEFIGSIITIGHLTIHIEDSIECMELCKKLNLKVFEDVN